MCPACFRDGEIRRPTAANAAAPLGVRGRSAHLAVSQAESPGDHQPVQRVQVEGAVGIVAPSGRRLGRCPSLCLPTVCELVLPGNQADSAMGV
jgi:hypothetical protein